jgi:hypothetical protein
VPPRGSVTINVTVEIPTSSVKRAANSGIVFPTTIGPGEIEPETNTGAALSITVVARTMNDGAVNHGLMFLAESDTWTITLYRPIAAVHGIAQSFVHVPERFVPAVLYIEAE